MALQSTKYVYPFLFTLIPQLTGVEITYLITNLLKLDEFVLEKKQV